MQCCSRAFITLHYSRVEGAEWFTKRWEILLINYPELDGEDSFSLTDGSQSESEETVTGWVP